MNDVIARVLPYVVIPAAAVALGMLYSRGKLRGDVFDSVSPRRTGIVLMDVFLGIWILLAAQMLLGPLLILLLIPIPGNGIPAPALRDTAVTNLIGQFVINVPIILFALWQADRVPHGIREFGLTAQHPGRDTKAGLLALLAALPIVLVTNVLFMLVSRLMEIEPPAVGHEMLKSMIESQDPGATALMIVSAVLVAPIVEEFVFRGLVQTALLSAFGPLQRWPVIFLAAGLFAFVHGGVATWQVLPGLFVLGVFLGWLYEKHGSLLPGIVLHMGFNWANIGLGMLQGGLKAGGS